MAYLTASNYKKLCRTIKVNVEISLEFFIENLYNDPNVYYILTKREIEALFAYKMMLLDENFFLLEYYIEVPVREDTRTFVLERGGSTKYHLYIDCNLLKRDYLDAKIPEEIRELGKEAIDEYRGWFVANDFLEKYKSGIIDKDVIIARFNLKYPNKYGINPISSGSNLLIVEKPNTGISNVDRSFDVEEFQRRIQELKNRWNNAFTCPVHRTLAKQRYLFNREEEMIRERMKTVFSENFVGNFGMKNIEDKIRISKEISREILRLLEEYIKWTLGLDVENKNFDLLILEQFGLSCCRLCGNQHS